MTEREHCEAIAAKYADDVGGWRPWCAVITLTELADLIERERAAAREQALEEAALLCDRSDIVMRPIGCETAGELAEDIRALKSRKP